MVVQGGRDSGLEAAALAGSAMAGQVREGVALTRLEVASAEAVVALIQARAAAGVEALRPAVAERQPAVVHTSNAAVSSKYSRLDARRT
jgi:hypothetical protein